MQNFLDFEKPLLDIQTKIEELRHLKETSTNIANELSSLQEKFDKTLLEIYKDLTPFQKVKVCRHQDRPKFLDIVKEIFDTFEILSGDRLFADDSSIKGGFAEIDKQSFIVIVFYSFGWMGKMEKLDKLQASIDRYEEFQQYISRAELQKGKFNSQIIQKVILDYQLRAEVEKEKIVPVIEEIASQVSLGEQEAKI